MERLYRRLLLLYPALHRYVFADEMLAVFREAEAEAWPQGTASRLRFCLREAGGLLRGALAAHVSALAETYPWCLLPLRSAPMTPERRYPRTSIVLMTVTLAIIVAVIAKAQGLAYALTWNLGSSVSRWPAHYGLLASIALGFVAAWVLGLAAWAVMHALHRTGVHRLDHAQTWPQ